MKWAQSNLLKLNDQKTDVVVFGTKHKLPVMKDISTTNLAACVCVHNLTNFCPDAFISSPNVPKILYA